MVVFSSANYPLSFMVSEGYPFNHLRGRICSGNGIHQSRVTDKEMSAHMILFFGAGVYIIQICYISVKTSRLLKKLTPNGSDAMFNGHFMWII